MSRLLDALRRHQRSRPTPSGRPDGSAPDGHATVVLNTLSPRKRPFFGWQVVCIPPTVIMIGTLVWLVPFLVPQGSRVRASDRPKVQSERPKVQGSEGPRVSNLNQSAVKASQRATAPAERPRPLTEQPVAAAIMGNPPVRATAEDDNAGVSHMSAASGKRPGPSRGAGLQTHQPRGHALEPPPLSPPAPTLPRTAQPAAASATSEDDHFRRALYYQRAGDFENALVHYRGVLKQNPANVEAHNNLGLLYEGRGLLQDAIREFTRALEIDPGYAKAHNNLGVALLNTGSLDRAAGQFYWLLARDAGNVEALVNLAIVQKASGRAGEARETLLRAIAINGAHPAAHYHLGLLYEDAREYSKAVEQYEAFLKLVPPDQSKLADDVREHMAALRASRGGDI